jgi:hypothetical protein
VRALDQSNTLSGAAVLQHPVEITPVERVVSSAHDLHVLLRHRLVRKPGSFEGLATQSERMKRTLRSQVILNPD